MRMPIPVGFEWEGLREFFSKRQIPGLERVEHDRYCRTLSEGMLEVRFGKEIEVRGPEDAERRVRRMLDLHTDAGAVLRALRRGPFFFQIFAGGTGLRVSGCWGPLGIVRPAPPGPASYRPRAR